MIWNPRPDVKPKEKVENEISGPGRDNTSGEVNGIQGQSGSEKVRIPREEFKEEVGGKAIPAKQDLLSTPEKSKPRGLSISKVSYNGSPWTPEQEAKHQ